MTFDGRLMTSAVGKCDRGANDTCAEMYYLANPPVGTFNVHLSFGTGGKIIAGIVTLYGIDQANPFVASGTDMNYDSGSTPSVDLASQPGDVAIDILASIDCGDHAAGPGQTQRWNFKWTNPNWTRRASTSSEIATGSTVNMSHAGASGSGCPWAYVAGLFRAANNATPTPTMTPSATPTVTATVASMPSGVIWRSYYFAGAQRVAMRVVGDPVPANNGVFYLLGDHLEGTNIVADEDGTKVGELRYKAWGETRFTSGTVGTDYRYTGQREEASFGLYYYRARWYDPVLGMFAQADTIVPGGGPMAWDRYAYVGDNPLRYSDPTGHREDPGCGVGGSPDECNVGTPGGSGGGADGESGNDPGDRGGDDGQASGESRSVALGCPTFGECLSALDWIMFTSVYSPKREFRAFYFLFDVLAAGGSDRGVVGLTQVSLSYAASYHIEFYKQGTYLTIGEDYEARAVSEYQVLSIVRVVTGSGEAYNRGLGEIAGNATRQSERLWFGNGADRPAQVSIWLLMKVQDAWPPVLSSPFQVYEFQTSPADLWP